MITCYIPLRFWFNRNPGLALPLIALQYHEVKVNVTLVVPLTDLFGHVAATAALDTSGETCADTTGTGSKLGVKLSSANLLVNYLYLDTDERRRFAQVSHEYLIEQVQHTGVESDATIDMSFNHPVKALFWSGKKWDKVKLQLNGHDRAAEQEHDYYHLVQPYESGLGHSGQQMSDKRAWSTVTGGYDAAVSTVGMYSFCLKPAEHQPSGTCNFSRIDNARLNVTGNDANLYLFALNYNVLRIMSGMGGLALL